MPVFLQPTFVHLPEHLHTLHMWASCGLPTTLRNSMRAVFFVFRLDVTKSENVLSAQPGCSCLHLVWTRFFSCFNVIVPHPKVQSKWKGFKRASARTRWGQRGPLRNGQLHLNLISAVVFQTPYHAKGQPFHCHYRPA